VKHAVPTDEELVALDRRGDRQETAEQSDDGVPIRFDGLFRSEQDLESGEDEETAENPDHPVPLHQGGADRDEDDAEDEGSENSVEQDAVLVFGGIAK
jgi:hypothetical protein